MTLAVMAALGAYSRGPDPVRIDLTYFVKRYLWLLCGDWRVGGWRRSRDLMGATAVAQQVLTVAGTGVEESEVREEDRLGL